MIKTRIRLNVVLYFVFKVTFALVCLTELQVQSFQIDGLL